MKKKQWLKSFGDVDDKYVHEAAPSGAARVRSGKPARLIAILAACMAFVMLAGTFALFIPFRTTPPSVAAYAGSSYYSLIQKFNEYNYTPPAYKNAAEWLWHLPGDLLAKAEDFMPSAPEESDSLNGSGNYQEVTDNQVAGVIEADHIKRSDTHIYYLSGNQLNVYTIEGEDSKWIGHHAIDKNGSAGLDAEEFFLSKDCKTVTVICSALDGFDKNYISMVRIVTLDVSDPAKIREISTVDVSGRYLSSRLTEHGLLLMTTMRCYRPDFDNECTFVPHVVTDRGTQYLAPDSIISPDTLSNASYTVMVMLDDVGTTVKDSAAFLSYSEDVYVSEDAIYATRSYRAYGEVQNYTQPWFTLSEISCMGYGADGFEACGSVTVSGTVLDQYSMDQYDGMLRVVTTTSQGTKNLRSEYFDFFDNREVDLVPEPIQSGTSADLYVIDLTTMEIAASVKQFAPRGETVRSARFDGNMAYVCTAIQQTDPVFFFDLSDLENIEVKETGTIAGFSTSLVNFGDGFLLGIGRGGNGNELKIEIYTESETGVESFAKYERPCTDYSPDYKAYYIDRENGLIGLGVYTWDKVYLDTGVYRYDNYRYGYIVLHFDGENLREVLRYEYGNRDRIDEMRGVYIDGYYYVLNGTRIDVRALELAQ